MPVISSNALASVLDSYSCVVMVSDTTLICVTPLALSLAAASMNHFISACCLSLASDEGWNSLSIHFFASASPAQADPQASAAAQARADIPNFTCTFIGVSSRIPLPGYGPGGGPGAGISRKPSIQP
ncbi:hypothetical protein D9M72_518240 [compost metagenome]